MEGIGRIPRISTVAVKLALFSRNADTTDTFTCVKVMLAPPVVLHLPAGKLAYRIILFLVPDSKGTVEDNDLLLKASILASSNGNTYSDSRSLLRVECHRLHS